ncbi:metal ABC transporter solute-binding protein, Zn/Mn family [Halalkalibacterium halodurans]|uniref:metal ABC transporter solute-binding protein, Zn/Mn family n=1 Tax=Halalkalibacterium halodurans TaxID=86665 RepID=UPI002AA9B667|nr:zinc ABC transporter substrate-binding protein [Halalkalibacterium halodurans]MDY7223311.1 zinc ABC transporter substrate-binding protein [Halalkalibacterium halodurans]MDY7242532.1 zinc ABC transporter substrate-binding protein [Halalkalibacterium halodurans]
MKKKWLGLLLAVPMILTACGGQETAEENEAVEPEETEQAVDPLQLYTTIFPLEDFAKKIGGEEVEVTNLVPVGADAHTYEPTARAMIEVAEGDAFIYNGAGLEGFADKVIEALDGENVLIVKASDGIELIPGDDHSHGEHGHEEDDHDHSHGEHGHEEDDHDHSHEEHGHGEDDHDHSHEEHGHEEDDHDHSHEEHGHEEDDHHHHHDEDPHVWLDPVLAITLAENIKDALVELRPDSADQFEANFEEVKAELEAIDQEFTSMMEEASLNTFIVSHAGYGYWEERYGLEQIGIAGLSPTNEPSQRQLQDIIELAEENGINHIFFEQNMTPNVAETVRNEVNADVLYLHNLEALVDEDVDNGDDYFSLMRRNIEALKEGLQ